MPQASSRGGETPSASPGLRQHPIRRGLWVGRLSAGWIAGLLGVVAGFHLYVGTRLTAVIEGTRYFGLADDQMISMRYARNLADGQGLLLNPGEPPVEGITNFLWTLWMAVGHLLPLSEAKASLWVVATCLVSLSLVALLSARMAARMAPESRLAPVLALLMVGFYVPLVLWTMTGWETGTMALLVLWMTLLTMDVTDAPDRLDEVRVSFALGSCVAVLLRMDGVVLVGALAIWVLTVAPDRRSRLRFIRDVGGTVALVLVALTLWRHAYYGAWLPNSFTLRVEGLSLDQRLARGFDTQWRTLWTHMWVVLPFVVVALRPREGGRVSMRVPVWVALAHLAYVLWVGGDAWEDPGIANRWLRMVMPGLLVLCAVGLGHTAEVVARRVARPAAYALVCVVAAGLMAFLGLRTAVNFLDFDYSQGTYYWRVHAGVHLEKHLPPDASVADWWGGTVPYFSGLKAVDLLGKSDPYVARTPPHNTDIGHNKWDYAYSIGVLRPDVIVELYAPTAADWVLLDSLGYTQGALDMWYAPGVVVPEPSDAEYPRAR